jgi:hypothetical protein
MSGAPCCSDLAEHHKTGHLGLLQHGAEAGVETEKGLLRPNVKLLLHHDLNAVARGAVEHASASVLVDDQATRQDLDGVFAPERVDRVGEGVEKHDGGGSRRRGHTHVDVLGFSVAVTLVGNQRGADDHRGARHNTDDAERLETARAAPGDVVRSFDARDGERVTSSHVGGAGDGHSLVPVVDVALLTGRPL